MEDYIAPFVAVSRALKKLIEEEVLAGGDETDISFEVPDNDFISNLPEKPVINIYLYSMQENLERRYAESFPVTAREDNHKKASQRRQPRLVDLNYMISVWHKGITNKAIIEQYLLSRIVQGIGRFFMMPVDQLIAEGYNPGSQGVSMKILLDKDGKRSQGEFWNALGAPPKPVINLEMAVPVTVNEPLVTPVILNFETYLGDTEKDPDQFEEGPYHIVAIHGTVKNPDGYKAENIQVNVTTADKKQQWQQVIAPDGFYYFINLPVGEYAIWAEHTADGDRTGKQLVDIVKDGQGNTVPVEVNLSF
ncbi:Pvc16 family protein [Spartinivicinus poritis]|uniref:Pvc16 family protein n=1 Tax=Spartinivicinus poritis TaxID=2994640 RepID=A0ABT5U7E4_9GAMM|nr:Pvc16 family protein [Spartinivicinus sp. A2-2]MDE1462120.1 Pvc16 family protein [Spartinivicinus sp. A2-2]